MKIVYIILQIFIILMHGKDIGDLDLPNMNLYPSSTGYMEHKKCFKNCVKDMSISYLNTDEE